MASPCTSPAQLRRRDEPAWRRSRARGWRAEVVGFDARAEATTCRTTSCAPSSSRVHDPTGVPVPGTTARPVAKREESSRLRAMSETPDAGGRAGPFTAFLLCALIWGSTFLAISIGNDTVPPVWAAALRLLIAAAILFVVAAVSRQPLPRGAGLSAAIGYGMFQFGGNLPLLYWGETAVPSGLSAVIFATIPITTMFMAQAFRLEKLTRGKMVAALIALVGVVIIFSSERMGRVSLLPAFAILLATWIATLGTLILCP